MFKYFVSLDSDKAVKIDCGDRSEDALDAARRLANEVRGPVRMYVSCSRKYELVWPTAV